MAGLSMGRGSRAVIQEITSSPPPVPSSISHAHGVQQLVAAAASVLHTLVLTVMDIIINGIGFLSICTEPSPGRCDADTLASLRSDKNDRRI